MQILSSLSMMFLLILTSMIFPLLPKALWHRQISFLWHRYQERIPWNWTYICQLMN